MVANGDKPVWPVVASPRERLNLMQIGKRPPHYLTQSLIEPGAFITKGFGLVAVTKTDGTTISGMQIKSDKMETVIQLPDASRITIQASDIQSQSKPISTMPPMGALLSNLQIRDVVAYLQTLK